MTVLPTGTRLTPLTSSKVDFLRQLIERQASCNKLTVGWKFKFLINTCYPVGRVFQSDRQKLDSWAEFHRLVSWTDTWEEAWIKVFKRHSLMSDLGVGFDIQPPYYGYNSYLVSVGSLIA